jgi:hypothetical protein
MIRTITLGKYITAQGVVVGSLPNGKLVVRDGNQEYAGFPVS